MSNNIMQDLHTIGLNPFAVTLLAESLLKSPLAPMTVGKPQGFFFPVKRSDCAGWVGVRFTLEAVSEKPVQPQQAQGEPDTLEKLRTALEDLDATEPLGPTTEAVIDAAQRWYLAAAPQQADRQRLDDYATEINRLRNVIQSACYGGTDAMIERWKQLFPDEPVPSVKAQQGKATPFKLTEEQHVAACKVLLRAHGLDGLPQRMLDAVIAAAVSPTPAPETCGNCDTPAPGCGGLFASDGKACKFHGGEGSKP